MYDNEFETKGNKISTKFKIEPQPQHVNIPNNSHLRFSAHAFHKINANFIIKSTMAYKLQLGSTIDIIIRWLNAPIYELCPCAIQLFNL